MMHHLILMIPFLLIASVSCANVASTRITGQLFCNGTPYRNQKVEIYEKNYILRDSLGASAMTDGNGYFDMSAIIRDTLFTPQPYFYMINWCVEKFWYIDVNGDTISCSEPLKVYVPGEHVTKGRNPVSVLEFRRKELTQVESEFVGLELILRGLLEQKGECRRITPDQLDQDPFHHYHIPKRPRK